MFAVETTFGKWSNGGNHVIVARYFEDGHVHVTNSLKSEGRREERVLTDEEWLEMWDRMRDNGYRRG